MFCSLVKKKKNFEYDNQKIKISYYYKIKGMKEKFHGEHVLGI
jgi:hypothetical protein